MLLDVAEEEFIARSVEKLAKVKVSVEHLLRHQR